MFDRLRDFFRSPPEEEMVSLREAVDTFQTKKSEELAQTRERADAFRADVLTALDDVEDALEALAQYDHDNTRVEDVTTNVARDRLKRIDRFDAPDDLDAFHEQAEELVQDLRGVSQKENAVLNYISGPVKDVFKRVDNLEEHVERLDTFRDGDYQLITDLETLQEHVNSWKSLQEQRDKLEQELDGIDTTAARRRIQELDEQLDELEDDPEQKKKEALEQELAGLKDERDAKQRAVAQATSKMERGLKKVLYQARNGDLELSQEHVQVLEDLKNGTVSQNLIASRNGTPSDQQSSENIASTTPAADVADAVNTAVDAVEHINLDERNRHKFRDGADTLQDLDTIREEIARINEKIEEKQGELKALGIDERRDELKQKQERVQRKIRNRAEKKEQLRSRIKDVEQELQETRQEIENILNQHLYDDITVEPTEST